MTLTDDQRNELIAIAAMQQHATGNCDALYEDDTIFKEYQLSPTEVGAFLRRYIATIDRVDAEIFQAVVDHVTEITTGIDL